MRKNWAITLEIQNFRQLCLLVKTQLLWHKSHFNCACAANASNGVKRLVFDSNF